MLLIFDFLFNKNFINYVGFLNRVRVERISGSDW